MAVFFFFSCVLFVLDSAHVSTCGRLYTKMNSCLQGVFFPLAFYFIVNDQSYYILTIFYLFILFLAALGLRCWVRAFSSCSEQGLLLVAVHRLFTAVASLVAEHGP